MFEQLGLSCYPKTSGSKGMQLYVPLNSEVTYEQTKPFAKAVAETLEQRFGDRVVSRTSKAKRPGKVLIDWSQNDRRQDDRLRLLAAGERAADGLDPAGVGRGRGGAGGRRREALVFDHAAVLERVAAKGDLFAPLLSEEQQLRRLIRWELGTGR